MEERINKYLSEAGYCSRREADRLVEAGKVTIDGVAAVCGSKVADGQTVCVDGKEVSGRSRRILLAFNKPAGIVCTTTDKQGSNNIVDFIGYPERIYPVGRLDKDSEGLILMTNDGAMMDRILRSANGHEKEYIVRVNKPVTDEFVKGMSDGVYLKELDRIDDRTFSVTLTQGLNRQIRRMCENFGYKVMKLKRIRIMNIMLGDLKQGCYRDVTTEEYAELVRQLDVRN